jgi:hypothetical protein
VFNGPKPSGSGVGGPLGSGVRVLEDTPEVPEIKAVVYTSVPSLKIDDPRWQGNLGQ